MCSDDPVISRTIAIDTLVEQRGLTAVKVTDEVYNSITHDPIIRVEVYIKSSGYGFYSDDISFRRLYVEKNLDCLMDFSITSVPIYDYREYNKKLGCYQYQKHITFDPGTFTEGKVFKVDKDNWDHFYLYCNDSWWMWDIKKLGVPFKDKIYCGSISDDNVVTDIKLGF